MEGQAHIAGASPLAGSPVLAESQKTIGTEA